MHIQSDFPVVQYEWQAPYNEALIEIDRDKLRDKLKVAEEKIRARLANLASDVNNYHERQAIDRALQALRIIKRLHVDYAA